MDGKNRLSRTGTCPLPIAGEVETVLLSIDCCLLFYPQAGIDIEAVGYYRVTHCFVEIPLNNFYAGLCISLLFHLTTVF